MEDGRSTDIKECSSEVKPMPDPILPLSGCAEKVTQMSEPHFPLVENGDSNRPDQERISRGLNEVRLLE